MSSPSKYCERFKSQYLYETVFKNYKIENTKYKLSQERMNIPLLFAQLHFTFVIEDVHNDLP